jgi:hypothetical protein
LWLAIKRHKFTLVYLRYKNGKLENQIRRIRIRNQTHQPYRLNPKKGPATLYNAYYDHDIDSKAKKLINLDVKNPADEKQRFTEIRKRIDHAISKNELKKNGDDKYEI